MPAYMPFSNGLVYSCEERKGQILLGGMEPVLCVPKYVVQGCA